MAQSYNSPESQPQIPAAEQLPVQQPEQAPGQPGETAPDGQERQAEKRPEHTQTDDQVVLPQVADDDTPAESQPQQPATSEQPQSQGMPAIADDVDVIEKAWVNKAKQIIKDTRDDPRAQEEQFEQLQIDYLKKRYGRDVKAKR